MNKISFAIIGGGPAAFYTSKLLAKLSCNPIIHILEKQLCPFGLIRYGVAPDHLSIKKSQLSLSDAALNPQFKYFGNTNITPSRYKKLREMYSGVIFAYGASENHVPSWLKDDQLAKGEQESIKFSRDIVYWYNGHPSARNTQKQINLKGIKNVTIIGNGNVAIDVARIFLRQPKDFTQSEMSKQALNQLIENNKIETVQIIGRRGVTHSAFSVKQIRQLHKLGIKMYAVMEQLEQSMTESSVIQCTALGNHFSSVVRMNKRKVDFIKDNFEIVGQEEVGKLKKMGDGKKRIIFRYLMNPAKIVREQKIIVCKRTELVGEPFHQKAVTKVDQQIAVNYDMLVLSTGFQVGELEESHYDRNSRKLKNSDGCVIKVKENKIDLGVYAVGWCKNGPKGVLDQTLLTCEQTFNNLRIHLDNKILPEKPQPLPLCDKNEYITFQQYEKLREYELEMGDKDKFIKRKLGTQEIKDFYGIK